MSSVNYIASETSADYHLSDAKVRLAMGPVGCGKSVASCIELLRLAKEQQPALDKRRYSRWGIIRNTYPELKSTTMKTWTEWVPEHVFGKIKLDAPMTQTVRRWDLQAEFVFLAIDGANDIGKLKSLELTGGYFNELQFLPLVVFLEGLERINRYPSQKTGAKITRACFIADTNPPSNAHWIYKRFEEQKPSNHEIFKYPPALIKCDREPVGVRFEKSLNGTIWMYNPAADYRRVQNNQDYWIDLVPSYDDEKIKVSLCGEYGVTKLGKPVYYEYSDQLHYVPGLRAMDSVQIGLGWDFGLTPACVIVQFNPRGRLCVLDELVANEMGIEQFVKTTVLPHLNKNYPFWQRNYVSVCDPAGNQRAQTDEKTCIQVLNANGIVTNRANTNAFIPRREAVAYFMLKLVDGKGAFAISEKCPTLRNGFLGEYFYKRLAVTGADVFKEEPEKNHASHPHDALQYIAMHYHQYASAPNRPASRLSQPI